MGHSSLVVALLVLSMAGPSFAARIPSWDDLFVRYFPLLSDNFRSALHDNCTTEYNNFLRGSLPGQEQTSLLVSSALATCIMDSKYVTSAMLANMQSAGVLLGILPTVLAMLGSNTVEIALISLRRPLFAACLAAASPAASPVHGSQFYDPIAALKQRAGHVKIPGFGPMVRSIVVTVEWLLVLAALGNVVELGMELGVWTVSSWATKQRYLPLLWTVSVLIVHLAGSASFRLRAHMRQPNGHGPIPFYSRITYWLMDEFTPCAEQTPTLVVWKQETILFLLMSWCTTTLTVVHIVYGVLMLSSLLFISVEDALSVVGRYLISALICRALLAFELRGMSKSSAVQDFDYSDESDT